MRTSEHGFPCTRTAESVRVSAMRWFVPVVIAAGLSGAGAADPSAPAADVTVTGEVVETSCYIRMGAKGESHRKCAELCVTAGIPLAVLDEASDVLVWIGAD